MRHILQRRITRGAIGFCITFTTIVVSSVQIPSETERLTSYCPGLR